METHHHQKNIRENKIDQGGAQCFKQDENQQDQIIANQPTTTSPLSSQHSSSSSSPSHEFSFTISLHSSSSKKILHDGEYSKTTPPSLALDLSPADEIFFHGHLLPLHLLSHLPPSPPRSSSTNSMESFTLPIKELLLEDEKNPIKENCTSFNTNNNRRSNNITIIDSNNNNRETNIEGKSKHAFSLFRLKKELNGCQVRDFKKEEYKEKHNKKKVMRFDVIHALKKYLRMVQPLVLFKGGRRREKFRFHNGQSSYSYSGDVTPRIDNKQELMRGWRGQYSAPASMRTSPTNSGLLLATDHTLPPPSDSTMEELQAAIQAAIAHCKNSIAKEEKLKC